MATFYRERKPHRAYEGNWRQGFQRHLEVAVVVGDRIRRLRLDRGMTLYQVAAAVRKPGGDHYSASHFSRLERGWANGTLYVYLQIAAALDADPWHLFAQDEVRHDPRPGEVVLLRVLREAGISPEEALARLATRGSPSAR